MNSNGMVILENIIFSLLFKNYNRSIIVNDYVL